MGAEVSLQCALDLRDLVLGGQAHLLEFGDPLLLHWSEVEMLLQLVDLLMQRSVPRHELMQSSGRHDMIHTAHSSYSGCVTLDQVDACRSNQSGVPSASCPLTRSTTN